MNLQPHQEYFYRNRGHWNWNVDFRVKSWEGMLHSQIPLEHKFRLVGFVLTQKIFGSFKMKTFVDLGTDPHQVGHTTEFFKSGICFFRSQKTFTLDQDGRRIRLKGQEYFWPFMKSGKGFIETSGIVDDPNVKAHYKMPMFGLPTDCEVVMAPNEGSMRLRGDWVEADFALMPLSLEVLKGRFKE